MTVNTTNITDGPYAGNDITTEFAYNFRVDVDTELLVYETDDNDVQTLLTLTTHYTVASVGNDSGGLVTRVGGALPSNYSWYIRSNYDNTQLTNFNSQGAFFPEVHEAAIDKLTFLIQQLADQNLRSAKFPDSYPGIAVATLPLPESDTYLKWASDGLTLENDNTVPGGVAAAAASAAAASTSEANASTSETNASSSASAAAAEANHAEEWAINPEDDPVSVAAGGDDSTTFSSLHWAAKAEGNISDFGSEPVIAGSVDAEGLIAAGYFRGDVVALTSVNNVVALDWTAGQYFTLTNTETTTFVFSNEPLIGEGIGQTIMLAIEDAGNFAITLDPSTGFTINLRAIDNPLTFTTDGLDIFILTVYASGIITVIPLYDFSP